MRNFKIIDLISAILICFSAGIIGSLFTFQSISTWYETLNRPFFTPPNWVFGFVWSLLYLIMGLSLYIIWSSKSKKADKQKGLKYFFIQLALNAIWSIIFFGMQSPILALLVIIVLWMMIFLTIKYFLNISKLAGWLLIPYLIWVSFAIILNISIVVLNR